MASLSPNELTDPCTLSVATAHPKEIADMSRLMHFVVFGAAKVHLYLPIGVPVISIPWNRTKSVHIVRLSHWKYSGMFMKMKLVRLARASNSNTRKSALVAQSLSIVTKTFKCPQLCWFSGITTCKLTDILLIWKCRYSESARLLMSRPVATAFDDVTFTLMPWAVPPKRHVFPPFDQKIERIKQEAIPATKRPPPHQICDQ